MNFEPDRVTSVDWATYPILETPDAPEAIDVVLVNRPDKPATGAGEGATRPISAAIANAVYNATGRRVRRYVRTKRVGENLAYMTGCRARSIVRMWMNSAGHRHIMLSRGFRRVGVAKRNASRTCFVTADFASPR